MVPRVTGGPGYVPAPASDFVLPFSLTNVNLRGRIVRLDVVSTRALQSHALPEAAARILGEALALNVLLGSSLKLEGRVSLQIKGDGPLGLVVADYYPGGGLRGYARFDPARGAAQDFSALAGAGILAITLEPKPGVSPYQGLVPLAAGGLAESAEAYFAQSEQLPTLLKLAAAPVYRAGGAGRGWCAGGLMVQALPDSDGDDVLASDDWQRIVLFLQTLDLYELLDATIPVEDVLWRLFHEDAVRAHSAEPLHFQCGCNAGKVERVLKSYSEPELADLVDPDGVIRARCEFCGAAYEFSPGTLSG